MNSPTQIEPPTALRRAQRARQTASRPAERSRDEHLSHSRGWSQRWLRPRPVSWRDGRGDAPDVMRPVRVRVGGVGLDQGTHGV